MLAVGARLPLLGQLRKRGRVTLPGTPINPDPERPRPRVLRRDEREAILERVMYEPTILCLCTGNAARSPMAQVLLADALSGANVRSAGTHVVEGQPVSWRTRLGLQVIRPDLTTRLNFHRSHQVNRHDVEASDLVLCMAGEHVGYVRREFPQVAAKTATIRRLARDLEAGHLVSLPDRLAELRLGQIGIEGWEDVDDPAGGDVEDFARCAQTLDGLVGQLAARLAMGRLQL